jgi:hypothetical protein
MVVLGLLPPYALEDVKQSYRAKAHLAHPDHGGNVDDFLALQEAYQAAREYVDFVGDRRQWIATMVERSLRQDKVIQRLKSFGANVDTSTLDALQRTLGDFAVLSEAVVRVTLTGSRSGNEVLRVLTTEAKALKNLKHLSLSDSHVTDDEVMKLRRFAQLSSLDLSGTPITKQSLSIVPSIPTLTSLNIQGTRVGWWARRRTSALMRRREAKQAERKEESMRFQQVFANYNG